MVRPLVLYKEKHRERVMSEQCEKHHHHEDKYILCRREVDRHNEVILAGPKAPSVIGVVDFKTFISEHNIHPLEIAVFLKVTCNDVEKLMDHTSWIEPHAKDNLLKLLKLPKETRHYICKFLLEQEGNAGLRNIPIKKDDITGDIKAG